MKKNQLHFNTSFIKILVNIVLYLICKAFCMSLQIYNLWFISQSKIIILTVIFGIINIISNAIVFLPALSKKTSHFWLIMILLFKIIDVISNVGFHLTVLTVYYNKDLNNFYGVLLFNCFYFLDFEIKHTHSTDKKAPGIKKFNFFAFYIYSLIYVTEIIIFNIICIIFISKCSSIGSVEKGMLIILTFFGIVSKNLFKVPLFTGQNPSLKQTVQLKFDKINEKNLTEGDNTFSTKKSPNRKNLEKIRVESKDSQPMVEVKQKNNAFGHSSSFNNEKEDEIKFSKSVFVKNKDSSFQSDKFAIHPPCIQQHSFPHSDKILSNSENTRKNPASIISQPKPSVSPNNSPPLHRAVGIKHKTVKITSLDGPQKNFRKYDSIKSYASRMYQKQVSNVSGKSFKQKLWRFLPTVFNEGIVIFQDNTIVEFNDEFLNFLQLHGFELTEINEKCMNLFSKLYVQNMKDTNPTSELLIDENKAVSYQNVFVRNTSFPNNLTNINKKKIEGASTNALPESTTENLCFLHEFQDINNVDEEVLKENEIREKYLYCHQDLNANETKEKPKYFEIHVYRKLFHHKIPKSMTIVKVINISLQHLYHSANASNQFKDYLISSLAHEVKTPFNHLNTSMKALKLELTEDRLNLSYNSLKIFYLVFSRDFIIGTRKTTKKNSVQSKIIFNGSTFKQIR